MRTLDAPIRSVLATLIIRYRAARRDHARTRAQFGGDHVATVAADARVAELWNTMVLRHFGLMTSMVRVIT